MAARPGSTRAGCLACAKLECENCSHTALARIPEPPRPVYRIPSLSTLLSARFSSGPLFASKTKPKRTGRASFHNICG